jgi:hypothetical protein
MSLLPAQDGLMRAGVEAKQTAFAIFRMVDAGVTMKAQVHFSKDILRTSLYTVPTGFAAAGIQADIKSLRTMLKGEMKCHSLLLD